MSQFTEKDVFIHPSAQKEIKKLKREIREEFYQSFKELHSLGKLEYPKGKKLKNYDLFEIRIQDQGAYRGIYCYYKNIIVILSVFQKKSQKTPQKEIEKAVKRKINLNKLSL
jgi:phage-related protein